MVAGLVDNRGPAGKAADFRSVASPTFASLIIVAYLRLSLRGLPTPWRAKVTSTSDQRSHLAATRVNTVYRLNQPGYLLAEWQLRVDGRRILRWDPVAVEAYARRVGRVLAQ